jgi:hypothetical protein
MVDYLHLELVRSLARDNSQLMGQNYPGPIEPGLMEPGLIK